MTHPANKQTLPTVTLAISAFNEAQNINAFLSSVLSQSQEDFILEKVLIISDGSTDMTAEIVRAVNSPLIELKAYGQRLGKSTRLNEIYQTLASDILVQSDADVIFSHPLIIHDLIQPIINEPKVAMCGGNPKPRTAVTFTEKAVNCTVAIYLPLRTSVRGGNNIFSVDGRLLAYSKELVKKIRVPETMIANDAYTYFCALTLGYAYRHVPSADVYFRSPQNLKDQIRQNTRFLAAPLRLSSYFPPQLVFDEYSIPIKNILPNFLKQFFLHPILCAYIFSVNIYCRLRANFKEKSLNALWDIASSTKRADA